MTLTEIIMLIANVIFIIIAIYLFVRLRKMGKKGEPEKKQQSESAGITNITSAEMPSPEKKEHIPDLGAETKPESFEVKAHDITPPEKPMAIAPDIGAEKKELRLEDELPQVKEMPVKKERKKKRVAKKKEVIEQAIKKEAGVPSEKIPIPETKEEKPVKKERKKKKVIEIKEETVAPSEEISIPEKVEIEPEVLPEKEEKKEGKKKRPAKKKLKKLVK